MKSGEILICTGKELHLSYVVSCAFKLTILRTDFATMKVFRLWNYVL